VQSVNLVSVLLEHLLATTKLSRELGGSRMIFGTTGACSSKTGPSVVMKKNEQLVFLRWPFLTVGKLDPTASIRLRLCRSLVSLSVLDLVK
jgi:hypothetical protein